MWLFSSPPQSPQAKGWIYKQRPKPTLMPPKSVLRHSPAMQKPPSTGYKKPILQKRGKADGNQSFPLSSARSPPPKAKAAKAPTSHPEEVPAGSDEAAAASALAEAERERYFERLRRQQPIAPEILDEDECRDALEANLVASEQFSIRQVMEEKTFKKHFSIFFPAKYIGWTVLTFCLTSIIFNILIRLLVFSLLTVFPYIHFR